ncbi:MAG: spore germination protein [Lachnospiraceae bacterium]|nr:spore germination protein [Lachnospiraceae bacterium]
MAFAIKKNIDENIQYFHKKLSVERNFDIIYRVITIGGRRSCLYMVDGFAKDEVVQRILQTLMGTEPQKMPASVHELSKKLLPYGEIGLAKDSDSAVSQLLMGMTILLVDGYDQALTIDCRTYPMRSVEEPDQDRVLRGSRDGFVETLVFNTALIRRRIRDPKLIHEIMQAGSSSQTDIAICYMEDRVDQELLDTIKMRIKNLKVDALTMNQESLAECIYPHKWYNPFPKFKYSERPDTAAACLLEGNIVILVDNSPAAMILPSSIFDIIEEANDYYFPPITGTYLRLSRFFTFLLTLFLTPTFLLLMSMPDNLPPYMEFILPAERVNVPFIWQFLILEFATDGLKLAAVNTPSMLTTPLSVIAALIIGDFSVSSGWFNAETMLYMAFVVLANYTQTSMELSYALKFMRIILLLLTAFLGSWGFLAGIVIVSAAILCNRTIAGKSYLYPLFPFDGKEVLCRFFRVRLQHSWERETTEKTKK